MKQVAITYALRLSCLDIERGKVMNPSEGRWIFCLRQCFSVGRHYSSKIEDIRQVSKFSVSNSILPMKISFYWLNRARTCHGFIYGFDKAGRQYE